MAGFLLLSPSQPKKPLLHFSRDIPRVNSSEPAGLVSWRGLQVNDERQPALLSSAEKKIQNPVALEAKRTTFKGGV